MSADALEEIGSVIVIKMQQNIISIILLIAFIGGQGLSVVSGDAKILMQLYAIFLAGLSATIVLMLSARRRGFMLSCFSVVLLAPIWFLYLEAIFPEGDCWLLPADRVIKALSFSAFFLFVFTVFYRFSAPYVVVRFHDFRFKRTLHPNLLPIFGLSFTVFLILIVFARYDFNWDVVKHVYSAGRQGGSGGIIKRGGVGGWEVFLQPAGFIAPMVPTIAALSWVRIGNEPKAALGLRIGITVCALFLVFVMFLGGGRGNMAVYLAGPAAIWWLYGPRFGRIAFTSISVAAFLLLIGLWEFQMRKRSFLLSNVDSVADIVQQTSFNPIETHRDNNLYIFTLNVMYMPDPFPYKGFAELPYLLLNPIPRAIWKNKPKGIQESANAFRTASGPASMGPIKIGTASLSASIVSDGFAMFHLIGISIYAAVFGFVASIWDRIGQRGLATSKLYFILNSAWIFWMLWGFRAAFAFVTGMYTVWGAYLGCILLAFFGRPVPVDGRAASEESAVKA